MKKTAGVQSNGAFSQMGMEENPGAMRGAMQYFYPLRAAVTGVHFRDGTRGRRTYVDLYLYDRHPPLMMVPLLHSKINADNGEQWTPEEGDLVAVAFFGGWMNDPVVIGYLPPRENEIEADAAEAPRYHRKRSGTSEIIDKAGNRQTHVVGNETTNVDLARTTIIEGNETVTVNSGDVSISVVQGKCTVTVKGKTTWTSEGTIDLIGSAGGSPKGCIQGDSICAFTGGPHPHVSATVKATP